jgi:hypothetical protein
LNSFKNLNSRYAHKNGMKHNSHHQKNGSSRFGIQSQKSIYNEFTLAASDTITTKRAGAGGLLLDNIIQL